MMNLGSILLGSTDPDRLRAWYTQAFGATADEYGWLDFHSVRVLIDRRDDVAPTNPEPARIILNIHTDDASALATHLDRIGVTWVVPLQQRDDGQFATLVDPDGNTLQIIQLSEAYLAAHR